MQTVYSERPAPCSMQDVPRPALASMVHAFATLRHKPCPALLDAIATRMTWYMPQFPPQVGVPRSVLGRYDCREVLCECNSLLPPSQQLLQLPHQPSNCREDGCTFADLTVLPPSGGTPTSRPVLPDICTATPAGHL